MALNPAASVLFFVTVFVAGVLAAHCFWAFDLITFLVVKAQKQRAVPTLQNKNLRQKIKPKAIKHNAAL